MACFVNNELISGFASYEQVTINFAPTVQRKTLGGTDYLVAPASMLVPGVLNGSKGPLYYPETEVLKNVEAWNMMPLTLGHPTSDDGRPVSARHPDVLEKFGLGFVFNATGADKKLKAEAWFDVKRTQTIAPDVLNRLNNGSAIELSTGLFTDNFPVRNKTFNGRPYDAIARNYRPDHLAILPNARGACSIDDGCGISVNKRSESVKSFQRSSCRLRKHCPIGFVS